MSLFHRHVFEAVVRLGAPDLAAVVAHNASWRANDVRRALGFLEAQRRVMRFADHDGVSRWCLQ